MTVFLLVAAIAENTNWGAMMLGGLSSASCAYMGHCLYLRYQMNRLNRELGELFYQEVQDEKCAMLNGRSHN